jgi:hypothetical protein
VSAQRKRRVVWAGRNGGASPVTAALVAFGALAIITAIEVFIFVAPASLKDLLLVFAVVLIVNLSCVAIMAAWRRITRKRRRDRLSG